MECDCVTCELNCISFKLTSIPLGIYISVSFKMYIICYQLLIGILTISYMSIPNMVKFQLFLSIGKAGVVFKTLDFSFVQNV